MKTNISQVVDHVRKQFEKRGYRYLREEHPDFGGVMFYFCTRAGREEAAYLFLKPSMIEMVTSDELGHVLLLCRPTNGALLQHVVSTSQFSPGAYTLAEKVDITLS